MNIYTLSKLEAHIYRNSLTTKEGKAFLETVLLNNFQRTVIDEIHIFCETAAKNGMQSEVAVASIECKKVTVNMLAV